MREIKFKQWDAMWRVMIQWEGEEDGPTEAHQQGVKAAIEQYGWDEILNNSIILQYTGLKDKNGKEIYEGDIVKGMHWNDFKPRRIIGQVSYKKTKFMICGVKQYDGIDVDGLDSSYEVIGNIYENKELLESVSND